MLGFARARNFANIVVHPTQELRYPSANTFRGGPDWPVFERQILARHCWGIVPWPVDLRPHPAETEWPYFDRERYLNPRFARRRRWHPFVGRDAKRTPERWLDEADRGIWCGPITDHFGHMIADFGMRIAESARLDPAAPLVFSVRPTEDAAPTPAFWQMIAHLGIAPERVLLIGKPTRFGRLVVLPQAERPYGGPANRAHLHLMDEIAGTSAPADREDRWVFVSRSRLREGRFAGEAYLDEALAAAGAVVFHPETADLHAQLRLYRGARRLIFSEGSALQALQLLGRLDAEIVVLPRRRGAIAHNIAAVAPLRARARSWRYLRALRGLVHGLHEDGTPQPQRGLTLLDERRLLAGFAALGLDLARHWDGRGFRARSEADVAAWVEQRLARRIHPDEPVRIAEQLRALSLPV